MKQIITHNNITIAVEAENETTFIMTVHVDEEWRAPKRLPITAADTLRAMYEAAIDLTERLG